MTAVKIEEVDVDFDFDLETSVKWIVSKVDKEAYSQILEQEKSAIAKIKKAELRKKRTDLRDALYGDYADELETLQIGVEDPAITPTETPPQAHRTSDD
jgi:hypothetical protein